MNRREYRKKHGIVCDKCKKSINKQIILRDDIWKIVVDKFKERIFEKPEDNLLCFECIENLLGRKIQPTDLKIINGRFVPANSWWIIKNNCIDIFEKELKKSFEYLDQWGNKYGTLNHREISRKIYPKIILEKIDKILP